MAKVKQENLQAVQFIEIAQHTHETPPSSSMSVALPLGERKVKSRPPLQREWLCGWAVERDSVQRVPLSCPR